MDRIPPEGGTVVYLFEMSRRGLRGNPEVVPRAGILVDPSGSPLNRSSNSEVLSMILSFSEVQALRRIGDAVAAILSRAAVPALVGGVYGEESGE